MRTPVCLLDGWAGGGSWCQCCLLGLPKISTLNGISYLSGFRSLMLKLKWHIRPPTLFTRTPSLEAVKYWLLNYLQRCACKGVCVSHNLTQYRQYSTASWWTENATVYKSETLCDPLSGNAYLIVSKSELAGLHVWMYSVCSIFTYQ